MSTTKQQIILRPYSPDLEPQWNALVEESKNGTFLFSRRFMDYHGDRFRDASLMAFDAKGKTLACLPANISGTTVFSHQGLTYGGLVMSKQLTALQTGEILEAVSEHFRQLGAKELVYSPTPYIYSRYPSQDDLYFLYRHGAELVSRKLSQTIFLPQALPLSTLRRRCLKRAMMHGVRVGEESEVGEFWTMLDANLSARHNLHPVHTAAELQLLKDRFPDKIRIFSARNAEGRMIAGTTVFDCGQTIHTQYIASDDEGKANGAFDCIVDHLIRQVYPDRMFLDFGVSTEDGGRVLNEGLTFQKESFGGRGVCYDSWRLSLNG